MNRGRKSNISFGIGILLMVVALSAFSQADKLQFDRYSTDEGLSHANVNWLFEDQFGFIWIGTDDGLNCFDGISFKVYRNNFEDDNSLLNSRVTGIYEDSKGLLWIGTNDGLTTFNQKAGKFKQYSNELNNPNSLSSTADSFIEDVNGVIWVATGDGLAKYRPESDDFDILRHDSGQNSISGNLITSFAEDQENNIWIGTSSGLSKYDIRTEKFINYTTDDNSEISLLSNDIRSLYVDRQNRLWIGHFLKGITQLDLETSTVNYFSNDSNDEFSLSNNYIQGFDENEEGEIWIATDNGLNKFHENGTFTRYFNDANNLFSLSSNILTSMIIDRNDNLWLGTRLGGVNLYAKDKYGFELFQSNPNDPTSLSSNKTSSIAEDQFGNLAVGTDGWGINFLNRSTGEFTHLAHDPDNSNSITNNKVLTLEYDSFGNLWIGMWGGGLCRLNLSTGKITRYLNDPNDPKSLAGNNLFYLYEDKEKILWIGTFGDGFIRYNRESDDFTNFKYELDALKGVSFFGIGHIIEDHNNTIYFSDEAEGLFSFNKNTQEVKIYKYTREEGDISSNSIGASLHDSQNRLWVGTMGGGLNLFDYQTETFTAFRQKDGLPSEGIVGILEGDDGNIWLSTNNGISKFNPDEKTFKNYSKVDGLQGNQFNNRNAAKLSTGELAFGGNGGFNLFDPLSMKSNPIAPPIYITDFKLFNKEVKIGENEILKNGILFTDEIELNHSQNFFSFDFIGLNYRHGAKNQYKYMMEGLQNEWVDIGHETKVSYTDIKPDDYVFKVMAANNDGVWSVEPAQIKISVIPPFWATWWFRGIVALAIISISFWFFRWRSNLRKMNQLKLENKVKEATAQVKSQNMVLEAQSESLKLAIQDTNFVLKEALESGNFSARIDTESKEGEWKALGESINQLFESVWRPFESINRIVNKMAEGDLTDRFIADAKGDVLTLSRNLNKAMDNLSELLSEISVQVNVIGESSEEMLLNSQEMNSSTGEIASSIGEMSKGAQDQVVKVDESSNLIEGILKFSSDMGDQAESINQTAELGVQKSDTGMQQIEMLDLSMKNILNYSDKTNGSIEALTKRSDEISGVVRIIKDIASQTNLLALNAAIEAAQAGDAGRGFAVVAEEIRKLAEDSKKSAGEIEELIAAVQSDTTSTAGLIGEMSSSIKEGEAATKHSLTAFEEISKYYAETLEKSEKILGATKQQTHDIGNVVDIINGVVVIAEETAAGTEEVASSSTQLSAGMTNYTEKSKTVSEITQQLRDKVGKFILKKMEELAN